MIKLKIDKRINLALSLILLFIISFAIFMPINVKSKSPTIIREFFVNNDEDGDGVADENEIIFERYLEAEVYGPEAYLYSYYESGENENEFEVGIYGYDTLAIEFAYRTAINATETEFELYWEFTDLIGYNDTNDNDYYDSSLDDIVSTYDISGFNTVIYSFDNTSTGELHIFNISTTDEKFNVIAYASNEFTKINDILIAPIQIKFDILINNFNGSFSHIALASLFDFEGEISYNEITEDEELEYANNESELEFRTVNDDHTGYFSWSQNSIVDNITYPVFYSPSNSFASEQTLYLNYQAGNKIIHDPKIGITNLLEGFLPLNFSIGLFFPDLTLENMLILTASGSVIVILFIVISSIRKKR